MVDPVPQNGTDPSDGHVEQADHLEETTPVVSIPVAKVDAPPSPIQRIQFHATWISIAIWAVLLALLVGFFAFASVTIYPNRGLHRNMRVDQVWGLFRDDLPSVHHPALLSAIFYVSIVLVVVGMVWMIFLALGTRSVNSSAEPPHAVHSTDPAPPQF